MQKHIIEAITETGSWIGGLIDDNPFTMQIEDELPDAIKFNRVTMLLLIDRTNDDELVMYKRHHYEKPVNPEQRSMVEALFRLVASLPKQEVWEQSFKQIRIFIVTEESVLEATTYDKS